MPSGLGILNGTTSLSGKRARINPSSIQDSERESEPCGKTPTQSSPELGRAAKLHQCHAEAALEKQTSAWRGEKQPDGQKGTGKGWSRNGRGQQRWRGQGMAGSGCASLPRESQRTRERQGRSWESSALISPLPGGHRVR